MRTNYTLSVSLLLFLFLSLGFGSAAWAGPGFPAKIDNAGGKGDIYRKAGSIGNCSEPKSDLRLDVNNVRARILNNGGLFWNGDPHVYEVPIDTGNMANFAGGIWIGGEVNGQLRVAAARYGAWEFWAGPLDANGNPPGQSPALLPDCSDYDKIYEISRDDIKNLDQNGIASEDITNWPYDLGAPVVDGDGDPNNYNLAGGDRPDLIGDQMMWWVMNDMGNIHDASDSQNIGLEAQVTAFAFNQAGDLGNMTFYAYKLIYKGDEPLQNTYMAIWDDPDLGDAGDDLVGSDTTLGLGYVYNSDNFDGSYGDLPPAMGYDFFKGPLTDTDGDGELERLGMSGFMYFINGSNNLINDPGSGAEYYYNMSCRLKNGNPLTVGGDGTIGTDATCFAFPGDPVTGEGWSEENNDGAGSKNPGGDRRFVMATGPFTMNPGETQEIVYGIVWAQGQDRLDSITRMRAADQNAQLLFDLDFQAPEAPDAPRVEVRSDDGEAYITWGYNPGDNNYLNTYTDDTYGYELEGYLVYQYDSPEDQSPTLLASYDKVNGITALYTPSEADPNQTTLEVNGKDNGLQNSHRVGGLTNYTNYYYGVQAYAYSSTVFGFRNVLYSPVSRVEFLPTSVFAQNDGTVLTAQYGDELTSTSIGASSDGFATARVVDPVAVNGHEYNVVFRSILVPSGASDKAFDELDVPDPIASKPGNEKEDVEIIVYDIVDVTAGVTKFDGELYLERTGEAPPQSSSTPITVPQIVDGLEFVVYGAPFNWKDFQTVSNANGPLATPIGAAADYNGFPGLGRPSAGQQANGSSWMIHTWSADGRNCYAAEDGSGCFIPRSMRNGWSNVVPYDFEWRFEGNMEIGYNRFGDYSVSESPFEIWRVGVGTYDDPSDDLRMIPGNFDIDGSGNVWGIMPIDHVGSGDTNDPSTDATYWGLPTDATPGESGYNAFAAQATAGCGTQDCGGTWSAEVMARMVLFNWNGGYVDDPSFPANLNATLPEPGTTFRMISTKPNVPGTIHSISTADLAPVTGTNADAAIDLIGIVPNPYRGSSWYETTNVEDEVRFTNLPTEATIRIFTIDGTLVRTLFKNSPSPSLAWNMSNETGLRLASGIYLIHVELADGREKVLKFAMVRDKVQLSAF